MRALGRSAILLAAMIITAAMTAGCTQDHSHGTPPSTSSVSRSSPIPSVSMPTVSPSPTAQPNYRAEFAARPLHLPVLRAGQICPTSGTTAFETVEIGPTRALGKGPVRPLGASADGTIDITSDTFAPGWLAAKTPWISYPTYQGPFLIRLKRIDSPGPVGLAESPGSTSLYTPGGPTLNDSNGYRDVTGATWVKKPGCVAWQVDGVNFSNVIVARLVCPQSTSCATTKRRS